MQLIFLQENAIYINGVEDGSFDNNDYILFYGIGPHSWTTDITNETASHVQNIYTNQAFYFINIGDSPGKRINNETSVSGTPVTTINSYDDFIFYEKEDVSLLAVGRLWFGESFSVDRSQSFTIPFDNAQPGSLVNVKVTAAAQSSTASNMNVTVNGNNTPTIGFPPVSSSTSSGLARYGQSSSQVNSSNSISIQIDYNNNGNPSARAFLDYIEVTGKKKTNEEFIRQVQVGRLSKKMNFTILIVRYEFRVGAKVLKVLLIVSLPKVIMIGLMELKI